MTIRVLVFGALAEHVGARVETVELPAGATVSDVVSALAQRYPAASEILERAFVAVNLELSSRDRVLGPADEVALLPPASGGATPVTVGLRLRPSVGEALAAVAGPGAGGTAVFVGTVRDHAEAGAVEGLDYSAYDSMAEKVMRDIAGEAAERWGLSGVSVLHATGWRSVGDVTFVVACSAAHRDAAFEGCRYVTDEVKRRAPIWKREHGPWGFRWVDA